MTIGDSRTLSTLNINKNVGKERSGYVILRYAQLDIDKRTTASCAVRMNRLCVPTNESGEDSSTWTGDATLEMRRILFDPLSTVSSIRELPRWH